MVFKKLNPSKIILVLITSTFLISCESESKKRDLKLNEKLQTLEAEIEIHILNSEFDSAAVKIPKLVHPSGKVSPIPYDTDWSTKEGFLESMNRSSTNIPFSEYWSNERNRLIKLLDEKKNGTSKSND